MNKKKVLLIDGNSLIFRAYFASAYSGSILKTKSGIPTNAVFSFANMITSLLNNEEYYDVKVAFDYGKKTFRHEKMEDYKAGRNQTPSELIQQFPIVREFLDAANISWFEQELIEADDIIGSIAKYVEQNHEDMEVEILSSDRDMFQLISDKTVVRIPISGTSNTDIIDIERLCNDEKWQCNPNQVCDMKGLMGDASDNLKGVQGVGPKTAIKLIKDYGSIEGIYDNLDQITGAVKNKLFEGRESAFLCKEIATIKTDVEIKDLSINQINLNIDSLVEFLQKYEMFSLVKRMHTRISNINKEEIFEYKILPEWSQEFECKENSVFVECLEENYHKGKIVGIAISNEKGNFYLDWDKIGNFTPIEKFFTNQEITINTFDIKKTWTLLKNHRIVFLQSLFEYDFMIAGYLLYPNLKSDLQTYLQPLNDDLKLLNDETIYGKGVRKTCQIDLNIKAEHLCRKAFAILATKSQVLDLLESTSQIDLLNNIDLKFVNVLFEIEQKGVRIDQNELIEQTKNILNTINNLDLEMRQILGINITSDFNFASPKQLKELLFSVLNLPNIDKGSTSKEVLEKLVNHHPIVILLIEHRKLSKLYSTYLRGFEKWIFSDGKVHPIFNQTLTNTGRLSCIEPNLQNISIRNELQKNVRKIFICEPETKFYSFDYSQIELRVLAQMGQEKNLLEIFKNDRDVHEEAARKIFNLALDQEVDFEQRRTAKVFNFGIIYGLSDYGLSQDLNISIGQAKEHIKAYYESFPDILEFKRSTIDFATKNGYVLTSTNRKRDIEELTSTNYLIRQFGERAAINAPIQGTAADILKVAMINIYSELQTRNLASYICAQIHDEIIVVIHDSEVQEVVKIIEDSMKSAYIKLFQLVHKNEQLEVELKINQSFGNNWYEMK